MARFVSVISGKGGTGKSTVSGGIAVSLAANGKKVLLIDMDIGLRALDIMLGLENAIVYDLGDVLAGRCDLEKATVSHKLYKNLRLLCSPVTVGAEFDIHALIQVIKGGGNGYDYVLLDLPAGLGFSVIAAREISDTVIVVATTDAVTMRDSRKVCDVITKGGCIELRLVVNRVSRASLKTGGVKDIDEVMDTIGIPLFGVLRDDKWIMSALGGDADSRRASPDTMRAFDAMARRLCGEYVPVVVRSC